MPGRERLLQARAAIRPSINLSATMRRNRDGSTAFDDTLGCAAGSAALTLVPPIFRPLNKASIEQAGWQVQQLAQAKRSFEVGTVPVIDDNEA